MSKNERTLSRALVVGGVAIVILIASFLLYDYVHPTIEAPEKKTLEEQVRELDSLTTKNYEDYEANIKRIEEGIVDSSLRVRYDSIQRSIHARYQLLKADTTR